MKKLITFLCLGVFLTNSGHAQSSNSSGTNAQPSLKVYNNYDFIPGDKILFEDNFAEDQDGEFPAHWELKDGQATVNKLNGELALFVTNTRLSPRMKTENYLTDPFTLEFDLYEGPEGNGILVRFTSAVKGGSFDRAARLQINAETADYGGVNDLHLHKNYPDDLGVGANFQNKWHHVSIAFKNHQLKIYVDQYRVLVVPDTKEDFFSFYFEGMGDDKNPTVIKNVRLASGGGMKMLGKKFTDAKIVTHGITFDIDKATIKPESMGTLTGIVRIMKENPEVNFEVDGHTDNTGSAPHNLTLSAQRAEAVKTQLVSMGIDASRLTTRGFGDTKPISENDTLAGKANNRRVEFVKTNKS